MITDIRLSVNFFRHNKTRKLERRFGKEGVLCLLKLWVWAAVYRPSGDLSGICAEDLEMFSEWSGEEKNAGSAGSFIAALREIGWLDGEEGAYQFHGWREFQTWVTSTESREDKARMSALARKNRAAYERLKAQGVRGITKEQYVEYVQWTSGFDHGNAPEQAPSPSPSPSPVPAPFPSPAPKRTRLEEDEQKNKDKKTDFERQWDGEPVKRFSPLDYIRKIQDIAANAPVIPERTPGKPAKEETENGV